MEVLADLKSRVKAREFFATGATRDLAFRTNQLQTLLRAIQESESAINAALKSDLGKSEAEAFISEVAFSIEEIKYAVKHLGAWAKPKRVPTPFVQWMGKSRIHSEPLGVVLIIGPWNYPFQLLIAPLVGAVAAGNCAVLKPSELAPATSRVVAEMIRKHFAPEFVSVEEGGAEVSQRLLKEKFDHIFFTGGTAIGRIVMQEAAKTLTPVTLELGGKSPCIIDRNVDLDISARRVVWGKFFNAGQTCVAPDYLLIPKELKAPFFQRVKVHLDEFFGADVGTSPDYARIINQRHYERLKSYLSNQTIALGGKFRDADRFLAPTLLDNPSWESKVMQEEIFGPILPVIEYDGLDEAIAIVNRQPKPLALYFFSKSGENQDRVVNETSFGGGCMNDTLVHLTNPRMPFGGVGESGMGAYHGKFSFDTFSHKKSVFYKTFFPDLKLRYPPYGPKLKFFRRLLG